MTRKQTPDNEKENKQAQQVTKLLRSYGLVVPDIVLGEQFSRLHDDHNGTYDGRLMVKIGADGDIWIKAYQPNHQFLRFRMPMIGGGRSQHTFNALKILALAIKLDNQELPEPERQPESEKGPFFYRFDWCALGLDLMTERRSQCLQAMSNEEATTMVKSWIANEQIENPYIAINISLDKKAVDHESFRLSRLVDSERTIQLSLDQ